MQFLIGCTGSAVHLLEPSLFLWQVSQRLLTRPCMQRPSMALLAGVTAFSRQVPLQVCTVVCPGIWQRGPMQTMMRLITAYSLEHLYPKAHPRSGNFLLSIYGC